MPLIVEIKTGNECPDHIYQMHAQCQLARELNQNVDFEETGHIYKTKEGARVPSITQVLELITDYAYIDNEYRDRGSYIHEATALIDEGDLDYRKSKYKKYITAWNRFIKDYGLKKEKVYIETPMISKYGYAGTPDRFYPNYCDKWFLIPVYLRSDGSYRKIKPYKYSSIILNEFLSLVVTHKLRERFNIK